MGRDTEFYKLDKIKAKEILLPDLKDHTKSPISFKNFCASEKWISPSSFDESINVISDDINQIDPENLWVVIKYIGLISNWNDTKTTLNHYGVEEILSTRRNEAYALMTHLNDHFIDDFEYNVKQSVFLMFVDYMILLSAEFALKTNAVDDRLETYIAEANKLKEERKSESRIQKALEEEIPIIYKEWQRIEQKGNNWQTEITFPFDYWFCYSAYDFLIQFSNIKKKIKSIHTNILIVDRI